MSDETQLPLQAEVTDVRTDGEGLPLLSDLEAMFDKEEFNEQAEPKSDETGETTDSANDDDEVKADNNEESQEDKPVEQELFKVKTKDGEIEIDREELVRGYQRLSDYTRNIQEAKRIQNELSEKVSSVSVAGINAAFQELIAADSLLALENSEELNQLRYTNPAEYMATLRDIDQQKAFYQGQFNHVQQVMEDAKAKIYERESQLLVEKLGETDPMKTQESINEIIEVGISFGLTPDEINQITDHRIALMAFELANYRKAEKQRATGRENIQSKKVPPTKMNLNGGFSNGSGRKIDTRSLASGLNAINSNREDIARATLSKMFD